MNQTEKVKKFLEAIARVCREHGLSLGHEDTHGAFIVDEFSGDVEKWMLGARDQKAQDADEKAKLAVQQKEWDRINKLRGF